MCSSDRYLVYKGEALMPRIMIVAQETGGVGKTTVVRGVAEAVPDAPIIEISRVCGWLFHCNLSKQSRAEQSRAELFDRTIR
jgi:hypothetical protein